MHLALPVIWAHEAVAALHCATQLIALRPPCRGERWGARLALHLVLAAVRGVHDAAMALAAWARGGGAALRSWPLRASPEVFVQGGLERRKGDDPKVDCPIVESLYKSGGTRTRISGRGAPPLGINGEGAGMGRPSEQVGEETGRRAGSTHIQPLHNAPRVRLLEVR
jgi:hypothetical protein